MRVPLQYIVPLRSARTFCIVPTNSVLPLLPGYQKYCEIDPLTRGEITTWWRCGVAASNCQSRQVKLLHFLSIVISVTVGVPFFLVERVPFRELRPNGPVPLKLLGYGITEKERFR